MRRIGGSAFTSSQRYDAVARRESKTATTPRSCALRINRPAPCASRLAARGRSMTRKALASDPLASRHQQRLVRSGKRKAIDHDEREGSSGDVDALPKAHRREQTGLLDAGELLQQRRFAVFALGEDGKAHPRSQCRRGALHRRPAREQRERLTSGRFDEADEFVQHRLFGGVLTAIGQMGRAVQQRMVLVVKRAADIESP